jgi:anti-sigma factor ChrR (cupin superfamily)
MDCKACRDNLSAYAELVLDEGLQQQVADHLNECEGCRKEAEELAGLLNRLVRDGQSLEAASLDKAALGQGARIAAELRSVHAVVRMRTLPDDNMGMLRLDHDFVPIELWKEFGERARWRVESPGRVVVMDGDSNLMLSRPNHAHRSTWRTFGSPVGELLEVDQLLLSEYHLAQEQGSELSLTHVSDEEGNPKLVVAVEARAQGDFTNDWLKDKAVVYSDNRRIYRFDARSKRLERLEVYVHTDAGDVLVLETSQIEYDAPLDPALFSLELPDDVIWWEKPKILPDNEKYERMSPGEAAQAYFKACSDEDWGEVIKFECVSRIDERLKRYLGGLTVLKFGEPFRSGQYPGFFIPYEIRLRDGTTKAWSLAMRNDNAARRYIVDGGI